MIDQKMFNKFLFNFIAGNQKNALEIMEASKGFVVPGIAASDFNNVSEGVTKVKELKEASDVVSVGLGGGGNPDNWKKALDIAKQGDAGHLNQPFNTSIYSKGILDEFGSSQVVNGLVIPSGRRGYVHLPFSNQIYNTKAIIEMASILGIESIKVMPLRGLEHLDEFVDITKLAAKYDIRGVEPAGGIHAGNIVRLCRSVSNIDIDFVMPHIFGSVLDENKQYTLPSKVEDIIAKLEG